MFTDPIIDLCRLFPWIPKLFQATPVLSHSSTAKVPLAHRLGKSKKIRKLNGSLVERLLRGYQNKYVSISAVYEVSEVGVNTLKVVLHCSPLMCLYVIRHGP